MEETMKNFAVEEEQSITEKVAEQTEKSLDDQLKEAVESQMQKIQRQSMLIGAQTMCRVVLEKIVTAEAKPGKRTMNDYKRILKDLKNFCETGLSRKVNADGETELIEEPADDETIQN